jgi:hypothetical protein
MRGVDKSQNRVGSCMIARWSAGTCVMCRDPLIQGEEMVRIEVGWIHRWCWGYLRPAAARKAKSPGLHAEDRDFS